VKLLFDENLSAKLTRLLDNEYPGSEHVEDCDLLGADDREIWNYARAQGLIIVSKDTDFRERSFVEGFPPKVIWLDVGNSGTAMIAELLRQGHARVEAFERQAETSFLILSLASSAFDLLSP
jgi:predicted nuclease of predicted toxin-antitoxin system